MVPMWTVIISLRPLSLVVSTQQSFGVVSIVSREGPRKDPAVACSSNFESRCSGHRRNLHGAPNAIWDSRTGSVDLLKIIEGLAVLPTGIMSLRAEHAVNMAKISCSSPLSVGHPLSSAFALGTT